jgi:hypothetical protein
MTNILGNIFIIVVIPVFGIVGAFTHYRAGE